MQYQLSTLFWQLSIAAALFAGISKGIVSPIIAISLAYADLLISCTVVSRDRTYLQSVARKIAYFANSIICVLSLLFCAAMASGSFADITIPERNKSIAVMLPISAFSIMTLVALRFYLHHHSLYTACSRLAAICLCANQLAFGWWLVFVKPRSILYDSSGDWSFFDQIIAAVIVCNCATLIVCSQSSPRSKGSPGRSGCS
ncbi:hypothetical protein I41_37750 [Lacipirellula limnantheis]|uniref:Uncharacterized protein n=1 Tax=Lacipirellula limnantheis TaxID=2528024 RepID=A0A517U1U1_9BACT|nr:hypothetical protein I41_37750 [Lacipirellula limnantheis]